MTSEKTEKKIDKKTKKKRGRVGDTKNRDGDEQTGIKVVTEIKYLGIEIRKTYAESMAASFNAVTERLGGKYDRISSSYVDLFHRRQLIQSVFAPSYNHVQYIWLLDIVRKQGTQ